jgi:hypothetical protein
MITESKRDKIRAIYLENPKNPEALCPICLGYLLLLHNKEVSNEDIVGCVAASEISGWTCCSKTKKTGCKNSYFHKECIETWVKREERKHRPPSCPICRQKKEPPPPPSMRYSQLAALATAAVVGLNADTLARLAGNLYRGGQIRRCHDPSVNSLATYDGIPLPECRDGCSYIKQDWKSIPHTFEFTRPPYECPVWMADSWENWHANMTPEEWRESQGIEAREYGDERSWNRPTPKSIP